MQPYAYKRGLANGRFPQSLPNSSVYATNPSRLRRRFAAAVVALSIGTTATSAVHAAAVAVNFDTWVSGTPIGTGRSIATLEISDGLNGIVNFKVTNTVRQLESLGLWQPNTGIKGLHLAYDRDPGTLGTLEGNSSQLSFTNLAGNNIWSIPNQIWVEPQTNASYEFNMHFEWLTSNSSGGTKRFTDGEWFSWSIESTDPANPLSILNFLTSIDPPDLTKPPSIGLAHVFSLTDGSTKEVVDLPPLPPAGTVAEPGTLLLFAGAWGSLVGLTRRRRH